METLKERSLDIYSVLQGKKQLISEMETLLKRGYSEEEVIKHIRKMYQNR